FQRQEERRLTAGRRHRRFALDDASAVAGDDARRWGEAEAALCARTGLFLWSARASTARITLDARLTAREARTGASLRLDEWSAPSQAATGERWEARCVPAPFPADPYDAQEFTLGAVIVGA